MDKYVMFLVLDSIARGFNEKSAIFKRLESLDKKLIEETLSKLEEGGYIRKYEKGRIFKKVFYELTPSGEELRRKLHEEIMGEFKKASELIQEKKYEEAKEILEPAVQYIPIFASLGFIEDLLLLDFVASTFGIVIPTLMAAELARQMFEAIAGSEEVEEGEEEVEVEEGAEDVDMDVDFDMDTGV